MKQIEIPIMKRWRKKSTMRFGKKIKRVSIYLGVAILLFLARVLPHRFTRIVLQLFGFLLFLVWKRVRMRMLKNLQKVYGNLIDKKKFAFHNVLNLSRNLTDFLYLPKMKSTDLENLITVEGFEHFHDALTSGQGVMAIGGHLGAWELIPAYFSQRGYTFNVISRRFYDERVGRLIDRIRESKGTKLMRREGSLTQVIRALKRGECVGVLIDQDTKAKGVWVDFMGKSAYTPAGAVLLAMRTGSLVLPMTIHRNSKGHTIVVDPPIPLDEKSDLTSLVQRCSKAVEKFISEYPEEWVWMHNRWRYDF